MCVQIHTINIHIRPISILIFDILVSSVKLIMWDPGAGSSFRSKKLLWRGGEVHIFLSQIEAAILS